MKAIRAVANVILGTKKKDEDHDSSPGNPLQRSPSEVVASFRVYIHRRNKLIHAWLRISSTSVILEKSKNEVVVWPLQLLRRYGYTSAGVFFFESGRRCQSGEGLHCFQSKKADEIFQLVQSNVEQCANNFIEHRNSISSSRRQSASSCLASNNVLHQFPPRDRSSTSSIASTFSLRSRGGTSTVRPFPSSVQRFRSEGLGSEILSMSSSMNSDAHKFEPNTYHSYHHDSQPHFVAKNRPRSVGEYGEEPTTESSSKDTLQPMRSCSSSRVHYFVNNDNRILGNILSERSNPRVFEAMSSKLPPYINISPKEVANDSGISVDRNSSMAETASAFAAAVKSMTASHSSIHSPRNDAFDRPPIKHATPPMMVKQRFTVYQTPKLSTGSLELNLGKERRNFGREERYINLADLDEIAPELPQKPEKVKVRAITHSPSPLINYAHIVPSLTEVNRPNLQNRCLSVGRVHDVNYTELDMDRTRAIGQMRRSTPS